MMKRVISTLLAACLIISMFPVTGLASERESELLVDLTLTALSQDIWDGTVAEDYAGGNGSSSSPYLIATPEQLARVAVQTNNGSEKEKYYKLMNDIYLNDISYMKSWSTVPPANSWTPIGTSSVQFTGYFDGGSHTVFGLYISTEANYQGLFGSIPQDHEFKNVGVEASYIKAGNNVGGVIGYTSGNVVNCHSSATVLGKNNVGGVVGGMGLRRSWAGEYGIDVRNSHNTGNVQGERCVGGVVGGSEFAYLYDSYNTGDINGIEYVGGISGKSIGSTSCWNSGKIEGTNNIGGIFGEGGYYGNKSSEIYSSFNAGSIVGTNYVGGIFGVSHIYSYLYENIISNCYNVGSITGKGDYVGGITGKAGMSTASFYVENYCKYSSCYNAGICTLGNGSNGGAIFNAGCISGSNLYYLAGCCGKDYINTQSVVTERSVSEMVSSEFVTQLNNGSSTWKQDTANYNSGYPILSGIDYAVYARFNESSAKGDITFDNSTCSVYVGDEVTITASIPDSNNLQAGDVIWKSDNETVAAIVSTDTTSADISSSTATITGVAPGTTSITITTSDGRSASCNITVDDEAGLDPDNFNEYIYRANVALNGKDENYIRLNEYLQGHIDESKTPSKVTADACEDSGYAAIAKGWTSVTTIFDSMVDSPTVAIKQMSVTREDMYTAIILDSLECSYRINVSSKASEDSKSIREWTGWLIEIIKNQKELDEEYINKNWETVLGTLSKEEKNYITKSVSARYSDYGNLKLGYDFFEYIDMAFDAATTAESFFENCFAYYHILKTSEEIQLVIQKMYQDCPESNQSMKSALKNCDRVIKAGVDKFNLEMARKELIVAGEFVVFQLFDAVWAEITKWVEVLFPEVFVIKMIYKAGKMLANELFKADAQAEAYYKLLAVLEYENLGRGVMNDLAAKFKSEKTEQKAKMYLESTTLNFQILDVDADYAIKFFKTMQEQPLHFLPELFGDSSIDEVITRMDSYKGLIEAAQKEFDTRWILGLEDYLELFTEYVSRLEETLSLEKQVTVSCPVNVFVYDAGGELVAYVKDGFPYATGNITAVVEGGDKNFFFYDDHEYKIVCDGYDSGTMDVVIDEFDGNSIAHTVNYFDIPVSDSSTHRLDIASNNWVLSDDSGVYTPTYDSQSSAAEYTISINNGFATTNNTFEHTLTAQEGEVIDISSYVPQGYTFNGWTSDCSSLFFDDASMPSTRFVMVNHDVVINAILSSATTTVHTVTLDPNGGVIESTSIVSNGDGTLDTLPIPARHGYTFLGWFTSPSGGTQVTTDTIFIQDTTIYAQWQSNSGGGTTVNTPSAGYYSVNVEKSENGNITASHTSIFSGGTVSLLVEPDAGFKLKKLVVIDGSGKEVSLTESGGQYIFKMPNGNVTVKAEFYSDTDSDGKFLPFVDVSSDAWYADSVQYVYENGLMAGTSDTTFAPNSPTTRAQLVTILYRMEGKPEISGISRFIDVPTDQWYTNAVLWATDNRIINGYGNGKFGPNDRATREQMVAILYRYANSKKVNTSKTADLSKYSDRKRISTYAVTPMEWAVAEKIITGTSNTTLSPTGTSTRAQIAAILQRYGGKYLVAE